MSKTITLRISEDNYSLLKAYAKSDNRKLSNAVETLAMRRLEEELFVDQHEHVLSLYRSLAYFRS